VPGFALADSDVLIGDRVAGEARWRTGSDVGALSGKVVRLRFVMRDADLYSFRFHIAGKSGHPNTPRTKDSSHVFGPPLHPNRS
jgi:hypothetical protein